MKGKMSAPTGFTLVELMVAMVLTSMLMLGLTVLYLTAQRNWLETSSKLMLQQNATLMLDAIAEPARSAHSFELEGDSSSVRLQWCSQDHTAHWWLRRIYWDSLDSLIHFATCSKGQELPSSGPSLSNVKVSRLRFAPVSGRPNLLRVASLRARDSYGQTIELSTQVVLQNYVN